MSIRVTSWVWEHAPADLQPSQMLLLLAVADVADDDGETAKGLRKSKLAEKARISPDTVDRQLSRLVERGLLTVVHRTGHSNIWQVPVPWMEPVTPLHQTPPQDAPPRKQTPPQDAPPSPPQPAPPGGSNLRGGVPRSVPPHVRQMSVLGPSVVPDTLPGVGAEPPAKPDRKRNAAAHRLPSDWSPGPAGKEWAEQHGITVDLARETDNFRDYWTANAGPNAKKLDWLAAWRTWIRRADSDAARRNPPTYRQAPTGTSPATPNLEAWRLR